MNVYKDFVIVHNMTLDPRDVKLFVDWLLACEKDSTAYKIGEAMQAAVDNYVDTFKIDVNNKDGTAGVALPNVNDNGDKIDGYDYAYKTDSRGEPYIHIDSVRSMLKKAADVQPVKRGRWIDHEKFERKNCNVCIECSVCNTWFGHDCIPKTKFCPNCGARMDGDTNV